MPSWWRLSVAPLGLTVFVWPWSLGLTPQAKHLPPLRGSIYSMISIDTSRLDEVSELVSVIVTSKSYGPGGGTPARPMELPYI